MPTKQTEQIRIDKLYRILSDALGLDMIDTTAIIKILYPRTPIPYPVPNNMKSLIAERMEYFSASFIS